MKFAAKFKSVYVLSANFDFIAKSAREGFMTKKLVRVGARGILKLLMASVLVATQCITVTPGIRGQAQNPPSVDLPSLVGKSMGDIIQQFKKPRGCKEVTKDILSRMAPDMPLADDICQFKIGRDLLNVFTYRGRAVGFRYIFEYKESSDLEGVLLRAGINVNGAEPQIREIQLGILGDSEALRYYVWSGTFNEKSWKEVRVRQFLKTSRKQHEVIAIPSDKTQ